MRIPAAYTVLIVLAATPAQAQVPLPHPDNAAFRACAHDMPVDGAGIPDRIKAANWIETEAITDHAAYDLAFKVITQADTDDTLTEDDWSQTIEGARAETKHGGLFTYFDANEPEAVRLFLPQDRDGLLVYSNDNAEWICHVFLASPPPDKNALWKPKAAMKEFTYSNGAMDMIYFDTEPSSFLRALLAWFSEYTPLRHATYYALDRDGIQHMTGLDIRVAFAAEIGGLKE